jgi:hypothetical protein
MGFLLAVEHSRTTWSGTPDEGTIKVTLNV